MICSTYTHSHDNGRSSSACARNWRCRHCSASSAASDASTGTYGIYASSRPYGLRTNAYGTDADATHATAAAHRSSITSLHSTTVRCTLLIGCYASSSSHVSTTAIRNHASFIRPLGDTSTIPIVFPASVPSATSTNGIPTRVRTTTTTTTTSHGTAATGSVRHLRRRLLVWLSPCYLSTHQM